MYSARITRHNPTCFIFLIDRSGSMSEKMYFGDSLTTKAEVVAMVTNMMIRELINRCRRDEGVMDYFDIAAIGYSGDEATMLIGTEVSFVKPSVLAMSDCPKRVFTKERILPDGKSAMYNDELPYWVEPKSEGNTPMRSALEKALLLATQWCRKPSNSASYPPTIFNITDGEATDGDHEALNAIASQLKDLHTDNGNALLININISSSYSDKTVLFPCSKDELPGCSYSEMLYDMSSVMPQAYDQSILAIKPEGKSPFRGMSLNTSASDLIAMMNIGSLSKSRFL